jgi:parallel beta-helix repeat protein
MDLKTVLKTNSGRKQTTALGSIAVSMLFAGMGLMILVVSCQTTDSGNHAGGKGRQCANRQLSDHSQITSTQSFTAFVPTMMKSSSIYYVSTNGNDDNDGQSKNTAFRTIERALEIVQPGEIISILPGIYYEALTIENMGSAEQPITIQGEETGTILDGQSVFTIGLWCENCTNFVFQNLEIRNYTDVGIGAYLSSDITMQNLTIHNNGFAVQLVDWEFEGYGIHVDVSERICIENSDVYQNGPQPRPWGVLGTGINVYGCTDCTIRNNHSYSNIGGGILTEDCVRVVVDGNLVNANYLDATEDEWWDGGIWIDGGHNVTVTNNTFQGNIGPGIQISDEDLQSPYGYVLEDNVSTENYYGIYIWNFGTTGYPPENVLRLSNNDFSGNTITDTWIIP